MKRSMLWLGLGLILHFPMGSRAQITLPSTIHDANVGPLASGVVYFATGTTTIPSGQTLTVQPGAIIVFATGGELKVQGTLDAQGTESSPIVFSASCDTTYVGSSIIRPPGFACSGAAVPGAWVGMQFNGNSDASQLNWVIIRLAGEGGGPAVTLSTADIVMSHCRIEQSLDLALLSNLGSTPSVTDCAFDDNGAPPIDIQLKALPGFQHNSATGNAGGNYLHISQGTWPSSGQITIFPWNYPGDALVSSINFTMSQGRRLIVESGVILKFLGLHRITVNGGSLEMRGTGLDPVVVTALTDDEYGGDTNGDGSATLPTQGSWVQLYFGASNVHSTVEHAILRYHGVPYNTPVRVDVNGNVTLRHVRSEHAMGTGFHLSNHVGDAIGLVSFNNTGDGIRLSGGNFTLRHATSCMNGMQGIQDQGFAGSVSSSISWANAGGNFSGFGTGQLTSCCGSAAHAGLNGNINLDPEFIDLPGGDLDLEDDSPCADSAVFSAALVILRDFRDSPRILDHELNGQCLPDMGAYERAAYLLHKTGVPRIGSTMVFSTTGAPGFGSFVAGVEDGAQFYNPYGILLAGSPFTILVGDTFSVGDNVPFVIPNVPSLDGFRLAIQALCLSSLNPTRGNFTNLYRLRFYR